MLPSWVSMDAGPGRALLAGPPRSPGRGGLRSPFTQLTIAVWEERVMEETSEEAQEGEEAEEVGDKPKRQQRFRWASGEGPRPGLGSLPSR